MAVTESTDANRHGLAKYVPILSWIRKYSSAWLRIDIIAGLTASAVVIPQAMEVFQVMELDSKPVIGLLAVQS
jgi:MFS superfamily sulfate permease-like transporter